VSELSGNVDDVGTLGDQEARERVAEVVSAHSERRKRGEMRSGDVQIRLTTVAAVIEART